MYLLDVSSCLVSFAGMSNRPNWTITNHTSDAHIYDRTYHSHIKVVVIPRCMTVLVFMWPLVYIVLHQSTVTSSLLDLYNLYLFKDVVIPHMPVIQFNRHLCKTFTTCVYLFRCEANLFIQCISFMLPRGKRHVMFCFFVLSIWLKYLGSATNK